MRGGKYIIINLQICKQVSVQDKQVLSDVLSVFLSSAEEDIVECVKFPVHCTAPAYPAKKIINLRGAVYFPWY
jgi:hypothetical protein